MLRLAVCDDSVLFLREMQEILETDERVESVDVYENPENLMEDIDKGKTDFDAIFMDIELEKEENGIEYVKEIFRKAPEIPLIYVTGYHDRYAQQIFLNDANLAGYLMKPLDKEILGQYLDKICQMRIPKHMLSFSVKGKMHMIGADSVWYLESDNHRVLIHTEEQMYSVYDKLSNFQKQLPASFIQCHKSFLVNMDRIKHIEGNEICFPDGRRVPISKIHREKVKKSYFLHLGKRI